MCSCIFLVVLIWARTGIQLSVSYTQISSNISANPICNVLLIHWVSVSLVSTRSRNINTFRLGLGFNSKCKLGHLSLWVFEISWILKIEVAQHLVSVRGWRQDEGPSFFVPQRVADLNAFIIFVACRFVRLRAYWLLDLSFILPILILLRWRGCFGYLEVWDWQAILWVILAWPRDSVVNNRDWLVIRKFRVHLTLKNFIKGVTFKSNELMSSRSWIKISCNRLSQRILRT